MGNCSSSRLICTVGLALVVGFGFGCGGKDKKEDTTLSNAGGGDDHKTPKVDLTLCEEKGKLVEQYDLNRDGRMDVWKLFDSSDRSQPRCKKVDLDHDGDVDYEVATNAKGIREFEKFDFDFDGRYDAYTIFDPISGAIVETQRDSDFDGKYDLKEVYDSEGRIKTIRRDMNADGDPDVWEQYVDGALVAVLHDENYDGEVDRKEDLRAKDEPRPTPAPSPAPEDTTPPSDDGDGDGDATDGDATDGDATDGDGETTDGDAPTEGEE